MNSKDSIQPQLRQSEVPYVPMPKLVELFMRLDFQASQVVLSLPLLLPDI